MSTLFVVTPYYEFLCYRIQDWDALRVQRTDALDRILESLGSQVVPPDFHQASSGSSLFGSQHSDQGLEGNGHAAPSTSPFQRSPTATLRNAPRPSVDHTDWKTLRDFVDERAIDDALETMDNDRTALDVRESAIICDASNLLNASNIHPLGYPGCDGRVPRDTLQYNFGHSEFFTCFNCRTSHYRDIGHPSYTVDEYGTPFRKSGGPLRPDGRGFTRK